jgi:hypothetical protein
MRRSLVAGASLTTQVGMMSAIEKAEANFVELFDETEVPRPAGASTVAAGSEASDAGALPAGTSSVYPTTAADDDKGVIINAEDKVSGRMLFIGNGVSNKILKVYPPTGGTINGAAANAAFSSVSGKGVIMYCLSASANTWFAW